MTRAKIGATRPHGKKARGADCKKLETETSFFAFFHGPERIRKKIELMDGEMTSWPGIFFTIDPTL
jgi:hypothetical protein